MAEDIRSFINDYNELLRQYPDRQDEIKQIVRGSSTDGEAQFKIRQLLQGLDNEGRAYKADSAAAMSKALNSWPDREEKIELPTTASVLKSLGYADKKDKSGKVTKIAQEQFVEDYVKKPKTLTTDLAEKKPQFGTKSADILRQAFRESLNDVQEYKTKERREAVLNGTAEDSPWYDKVAAKLMPIFAPAERDAYLRGEDPSIGDYAADLGGNALMLVPSAKYVQLAGKIPGVAAAGAKVASKSPRAAKIISGAFGNSVAPAGTEALQFAGDAVDSDREAKYNSSRAVLGALTNYGVNDILLRNAAALNRVLLDKDAGRAATTEAREALKGASSKITPKDWVQAYVVNKLGDAKAADYAAAKFGIGDGTIKALRANQQEVDDARYAEPELDAENLTAQDQKYIMMILEDPDIITESKDTGFRMWFATRGNELLRDTPHHVPTMEVK